jgi:hypothetical protein
LSIGIIIILSDPTGKGVIKLNAMNNESIPINLVADFDEFVSYISGHVVHLTKTKEYISRKHLPTINERMTIFY